MSKTKLTNEQLEELTQFLSKFKRYEAPAKFYVAYLLLIVGDEVLENADYDYLGESYKDMINDRQKGVRYE